MRSVHHDHFQQVPGPIGAEDQVAGRVLANLLHDDGVAYGMDGVLHVDVVAIRGSEDIRCGIVLHNCLLRDLEGSNYTMGCGVPNPDDPSAQGSRFAKVPSPREGARGYRAPGWGARRPAKAPLVRLSIVYVLDRRVLSFVLLRFRSEHSKDLELVALRHELSVLRRQVTRPQLDDGDRVFLTLTGRVLRYVAVEDDEAAPLVSFGSPADPKACMGRTCTVTDRVSIGMNAASRLGRPNDPADLASSPVRTTCTCTCT